MNKPVKTKLCWNCEGNVSRFAENCPYCAVYLNPDSDDLKEEEAFMRAPYGPEKKRAGSDIPKAPYKLSNSPLDGDQNEDDSSLVKEEALMMPQTLFQSIFVPLLFLTTGLICLFFALTLVLFSENGKLTLQWSAEYWYVYGIAALPLLLFGWKFLSQVKES